MSDYLEIGGILAATILFVVVAGHLIRWTSVGTIWLSRALTGLPRYVRKEPYNAALNVPKGMAGEPFWGPNWWLLIILFTVVAIGTVLVEVGYICPPSGCR